jgi:hypothetical protein
MTKPRKKQPPRLTIALLMGLVASCALLLAIVKPLFRHRPPPCLSHFNTARWLVGNLGTADCNQCHMTAPQSTPAQLAGRLAQMVAPSSPPHAAFDKQSCLQCHAASP